MKTIDIWLKDKKTGFECGINAYGELFLGNDIGGANLPDTLENRERIIYDFCRYTGRQKPIISASGKPITDINIIQLSR